MQRLGNKDLFSITLACMCHNIGHQGVNNKFLVIKKDELALTYNDISVT